MVVLPFIFSKEARREKEDRFIEDTYLGENVKLPE